MICNTHLVPDGLQVQIEVVVNVLVIFGARMNILFIIQLKILVCVELSYMPFNYVACIQPSMDI